MKVRWKVFVLVMAVVSIGAESGMSARPEATALTAPIVAAPTAAAREGARETQESQTSAQLLQEVRALRLAIERMTAAGTRAQLLFGRLQMQEQRLTSLGRQFQETRSKLESVQRERQYQAERMETLTAGFDGAANAEIRRDMESAAKQIKLLVAQLDQQVSTLQAEDIGFAQALAAEQARWVELNGRLEELENVLATQKP